MTWNAQPNPTDGIVTGGVDISVIVAEVEALADAAETSATNAATSATNAATSATAASDSATAAQTAETNAETAETNAELAEANAEQAAVDAAASAAEITEHWINPKHDGAVGDGVANDSQPFTDAKDRAPEWFDSYHILIPPGVYNSVLPSVVTSKNIVYEYTGPSDADNVLDSSGARGGYFADYECVAMKTIIAQFDEDQSGTAGGGFRDLLFLDVLDSDLVNYTAVGQKVTHGIRSYVQGQYSSGYVAIYKDLVGGSFAALGNVQWAARGCSGITAEAWQYGIGIASNECAVNNPASGDGGAAQSESMAALQAIIRSQYADEDGSHLSRGIIVQNMGLRITAAIEILSTDLGGSFTSHHKYGIKMNGATINDAAIVMGGAGAGASIIRYDTNDYSSYDTGNNQFNWTIGANTIFSVKSNTVFIAETTNGSPVEGDFWYDGTNLRFRDATTSRTLTWT